jgi:hypothetical protein
LSDNEKASADRGVLLPVRPLRGHPSPSVAVAAEGKGALRVGLDRSNIDRTAAENALYGSDDELHDQAARVKTLTTDIAKRRKDEKTHETDHFENPAQWRVKFNHDRQLRSATEALTSATSRAGSERRGVQHSREFELLRDSRAEGASGGPATKALYDEREALRNKGEHPSVLPELAKTPGERPPIPSRKLEAPSIPAAAASSSSAPVVPASPRGGTHAPSTSPRKPGDGTDI